MEAMYYQGVRVDWSETPMPGGQWEAAVYSVDTHDFVAM
jgi:hypothetical protein